MKNSSLFILALCLCVACSPQKEQEAVQIVEEIQELAPQSVEELNLEQSPYNFSSLPSLRMSVLIQAQREDIDIQEARALLDDFSEKLVMDNIEELSQAQSEDEADAIMMKIFMKAMATKDLRDIFELEKQ